ncbi:MAG: DUF4406 domain-containing protein [Spirochaetaceae bacterium]|nr:DUF4406 domain-containing protein [Spirochaetaceae bacterium]
MKYYLSGAITRQPDFKEYFKKYENELRNRGIADIYNPAGFDLLKASWEAYMKFDIQVLLRCGCLVLLPNWRKSRGAKVEIYLCKKLGIRVVKFHDLLRELARNAA